MASAGADSGSIAGQAPSNPISGKALAVLSPSDFDEISVPTFEKANSPPPSSRSSRSASISTDPTTGPRPVDVKQKGRARTPSHASSLVSLQIPSSPIAQLTDELSQSPVSDDSVHQEEFVATTNAFESARETSQQWRAHVTAAKPNTAPPFLEPEVPPYTPTPVDPQVRQNSLPPPLPPKPAALIGEQQGLQEEKAKDEAWYKAQADNLARLRDGTGSRPNAIPTYAAAVSAASNGTSAPRWLTAEEEKTWLYHKAIDEAKRTQSQWYPDRQNGVPPLSDVEAKERLSRGLQAELHRQSSPASTAPPEIPTWEKRRETFAYDAAAEFDANDGWSDGRSDASFMRDARRPVRFTDEGAVGPLASSAHAVAGDPPAPSGSVPGPTAALPTYQLASDEHDVRVDRLGEELSEDAPIWSVYAAAAGAHDNEMIDGFNKSLDVLLIFSSLFSAVVTAFVIESSKLLQIDYTQANALLTAHLLSAMTNTSLLPTVPPADEILSFNSTWSAQTVNILWFSALGFSLAAVLVAMLAKQWLSAYMSMRHADPHEYARERQRRFDDARRWGLPHVITVLPVLLHVALFLFLTGLIIYMWQLDPKVSQATCIILGLLFAFYFSSGVLAVFDASCPYVTPVSIFVRAIFVRRGKKQTSDCAGSGIVSRSAIWLASFARDPKTVSAALQALAGLRRYFPGYEKESAGHLARLALDRLRSCFIHELGHGGAFCLRTEAQYEASCYARTLMNVVDDNRADPYDTELILHDSTLETFFDLLSRCSDPSLSLLALCDKQRLLHRMEFSRWAIFRDRHGLHSADEPWNLIRSPQSSDNLSKIHKQLTDYSKGHIFLQPFAIKMAVEAMAFAPLPWAVLVTTHNVSLEPCLSPLLRLQHATREVNTDLREALAKAFVIYAKIHEASLVSTELYDLLEVIESVTDEMHRIPVTKEVTRERILFALGYFAGVHRHGNDILLERICDELFFEVDKDADLDDAFAHYKSAACAMLPLLSEPTSDRGLPRKVLTRLQALAVFAIPGYDVPHDSVLHRVAPQDPFPADTVPTLLKTLQDNVDATHSWLSDVCIVLYIITRRSTHKRALMERLEDAMDLAQDSSSEEVSSYLFWIITELLGQAVDSSDNVAIREFMTAGVLDLLETYREKPGLIPADAQAWADILPTLLATTITASVGLEAEAAMTMYERLTDGMWTDLRNCTDEEGKRLKDLRAPLLQFSAKPPLDSDVQSVESSMRTAKDSYSSTLKAKWSTRTKSSGRSKSSRRSKSRSNFFSLRNLFKSRPVLPLHDVQQPPES